LIESLQHLRDNASTTLCAPHVLPRNVYVSSHTSPLIKKPSGLQFIDENNKRIEWALENNPPSSFPSIQLQEFEDMNVLRAYSESLIAGWRSVMNDEEVLA
jgi:hypothetical protein